MRKNAHGCVDDVNFEEDFSQFSMKLTSCFGTHLAPEFFDEPDGSRRKEPDADLSLGHLVRDAVPKPAH